jgi:biotin transporter BioY
MGGTEFTIGLALGAFLLASWVDSKVGDSRRPQAPAKRFAHAVAGLLAVESAVGLLYLVQAAGAPRLGVLLAVFVFFLPALTYSLLAAQWLLRTLVEIMRFAGR